MKIILYKNKGELNRLDKSNYLESIIELNGTLRNATSLLTPSIQLEYQVYDYKYIVDDDSLLVVDDDSILIDYLTGETNLILEANYMYIEEFKRYYFINDIVSVSTNLWMISANVDVLMSYKELIKKQSAFIDRQENVYNLSIVDDLIPSKHTLDIQTYQLDSFQYKSPTFTFKESGLNYHYVANVLNSNHYGSYSNKIKPIDSLPNIYSNNYSGAYSTYTYALNSSDVYNLTYSINKDVAKASYVKTLTAYPFDIEYIASEEPFKVGNNQSIYESQTETEAKAHQTQYIFDSYKILNWFKTSIDTTKFYNKEPYSKYEIYIPFLSWVEVSSDYISDELMLYYNVDYSSGESVVTLYDVTKNYIVYSNSVNLGVTIGLSTDNTYQIEQQKKVNEQNMYLGVLSGAISGAIGYASGNPIALVGGVMSATQSVIKRNQSDSLLFPSANVSNGSGGNNLSSPLKALLRVSRKELYYPTNYGELNGYPLNETRLIGNLTGYTRVGEVHLEGFDSATSSELTEIESKLKEGFII